MTIDANSLWKPKAMQNSGKFHLKSVNEREYASIAAQRQCAQFGRHRRRNDVEIQNKSIFITATPSYIHQHIFRSHVHNRNESHFNIYILFNYGYICFWCGARNIYSYSVGINTNCHRSSIYSLWIFAQFLGALSTQSKCQCNHLPMQFDKKIVTVQTHSL